MSKQIDYYFAPASPWTYLGHRRLRDIAARQGARIEVKPMDLGKIFSVSGGLPLAKRPAQRQAYRLDELKRWSAHLNVPLNLQPKFFPAPGDPAAKLIIACKLAHGTEAALDLSEVIMRALWAEERNIGDTDTLAALATQCSLDAGKLLQAADTAGVQAEYERYTNEAIAANVFGSPWYVVDGEGFWGQDRLDFVERALQK